MLTGHGVLAMPAPNNTALVTYTQLMAPNQATALEHRTTVFGRHAREKAVLAASRNTFWLPGTLTHGLYILTIVSGLPVWVYKCTLQEACVASLGYRIAFHTMILAIILRNRAHCQIKLAACYSLVCYNTPNAGKFRAMLQNFPALSTEVVIPRRSGRACGESPRADAGYRASLRLPLQARRSGGACRACCSSQT